LYRGKCPISAISNFNGPAFSAISVRGFAIQRILPKTSDEHNHICGRYHGVAFPDSEIGSGDSGTMMRDAGSQCQRPERCRETGTNAGRVGNPEAIRTPEQFDELLGEIPEPYATMV
jgi:hypothetical protein